MRLCRYDDDRLGVVRGEMVHDVTEAQAQIRAAAPYAMKGDAVIEALPAWRSRLEEMAAKNAKPSPAIGTAGLFLKANSSLVGPSEGVAIRFPERRNEHEVELAIIFGKQGSDIPRANALDYVIGSWLVTTDEIPDPDNVPLEISVNGEVKQNSNTKQLIYDCRKLIEWGSTFYTFYPGDVL